MFQKKQKVIFGIKTIPLLFLTICFTAVIIASAQENTLKDADLDGISDTAETEKYHTDPNNPDTDSDGVLDYIEILENTDPTNPISNKLNTSKSRDKKLIHKNMPTMWLIGRISGVASFIMFTFVVIFGLLMTSKILLKFRFIFPNEALTVHMNTATFIAFSLLILHIGSFFFDDFIMLHLREVFIPMALKRDLTSALEFDLTIPVTLGVISLYTILTLLITSHLRNKIIPSKVWRATHYLSFFAYLTFLLHGISAGTDTTEWWMILIYSLSFLIVSTLVTLRIFAKKLFLPKPKSEVDKKSDTKSQE